jgi:hypothetical protein
MSRLIGGRWESLTLVSVLLLLTGLAALSTPTRPATAAQGAAAAAAAAADVIVYGGPSSEDFGGLSKAVGPRSGPGGFTVEARPVQGWGLRPGMGAWMTTATSTGKLVIPAFPTTWNALVRTGNTMSVSVLDPAAASATTLDVTRVGSSSPCFPQDPAPGGCPVPAERTAPVGGADVADVCRVTTSGGGERIIGISSAGSTAVTPAGLRQAYPSMVLIDATAPVPSYQPVTADELRNQALAYDNGRDAPGFPIDTVGGFNECDPLPGGGFVVTQYFGDPGTGRRSGRVSLFSTTDPNVPVRLVDSFPLPGYRLDGKDIYVSPKSIRVDPVPLSRPSSTRSEWRVIVSHDLFASIPAAGAPLPDPLPGALQEFTVSLDRRSSEGSVALRSKPIVPAGGLGFNAHAVSPSDRTLFVGVGALDSLDTSGLYAYRSTDFTTSGRQSDDCTDQCPVVRLPASGVGRKLPGSDWTASDTDRAGAYFKAVHVAGGAATASSPNRVLATMNDGRIRPFHWKGWTTTAATKKFCDVATGADHLVTPTRDRWDTTVSIGAEKGTVVGNRLYVPLFTQVAGSVNAFRTTAQYRRDRQWIESVDVGAAFLRERTADRVAGVTGTNGCSVRVDVNLTIDGDDWNRHVPLKVTAKVDGQLIASQDAVKKDPYRASLLVPVPQNGQTTQSYRLDVTDETSEAATGVATITPAAGARVDLHVPVGSPVFIRSALEASFGNGDLRVAWAARSGGPTLQDFTVELLNASGTVVRSRTVPAPTWIVPLTSSRLTGLIFDSVPATAGMKVRLTTRNRAPSPLSSTYTIPVPYHDAASAAGRVTTFVPGAVNAPQGPVTVMTANRTEPEKNSQTCARLGDTGKDRNLHTDALCEPIGPGQLNNVQVGAGRNGIPRDAHKVNLRVRGTASQAGTVTVFPATGTAQDPATAYRSRTIAIPAGAFAIDVADVAVGAAGLMSVTASVALDLAIDVTAVTDTGLT